MPKPTGFVVELGVKDVNESTKFYADVLGCSILESVNDESGHTIWAEIELFGSRAMVQELGLLRGELPNIGVRDTLNRFALIIRVGSKNRAQELYDKICSAGIILNSGPIETDYGTYEFSILDPDGFVILIAGRD